MVSSWKRVSVITLREFMLKTSLVSCNTFYYVKWVLASVLVECSFLLSSFVELCDVLTAYVLKFAPHQIGPPLITGWFLVVASCCLTGAWVFLWCVKTIQKSFVKDFAILHDCFSVLVFFNSVWRRVSASGVRRLLCSPLVYIHTSTPLIWFRLSRLCQERFPQRQIVRCSYCLFNLFEPRTALLI